MRISACVVIGAVAFAAGGLFGQTEAGPPAFEVASVKPSNPQGGPTGLFTYPGGRIVASNCLLEYLIEQAFDVRSFQVSGGPGWMNDDRFDIEARPPASSESSKANPSNFKLPPNDEQRRMLQTLLVDRFQLKFHRGTKEAPVYVLAKGNKALKLQETKDKNDYPWAGSIAGGAIAGDGLAGINISMAQLAARLSEYMGRPVLDQTGLTGSFDFRYEYHSDDPHPDVVSSIITSVQALGLRLEASKGSIETIVIDHAERPSAN